MARYSKKHDSKCQNRYTEEFKRDVCNDFLTGSLTRKEVERKCKISNSMLTIWLKKLGYYYSKARLIPLSIMAEPSKSDKEDQPSVSELKKELEDAKLLAEAYRRMIDKAEHELKIEIRKKSSTK